MGSLLQNGTSEIWSPGLQSPSREHSPFTEHRARNTDHVAEVCASLLVCPDSVGAACSSTHTTAQVVWPATSLNHKDYLTLHVKLTKRVAIDRPSSGCQTFKNQASIHTTHFRVRAVACDTICGGNRHMSRFPYVTNPNRIGGES